MSCFCEFDDTKENFVVSVALGGTVQEAVNSIQQKLIQKFIGEFAIQNPRVH